MPTGQLSSAIKYFFWKYKATFTRTINAGTSTNGPITAAKADPDLIPKVAMAPELQKPSQGRKDYHKGDGGSRVLGFKVQPVQHRHN